MKKYAAYITKECRPQVFLAGQVESEPDIHDRLIKVIQASYRDGDTKDLSTVNFKSVPAEQALPEKKPPKETLSTEGILKHNWPAKHFELVPFVIVFTVPFSVDWTISEWIRKEAWIQDRYNRLKALTSAREIKIIVTVIKVGAGATDKEALDERMNSLKRHLQLDSRTFHLLTSHDISTNSTNMKKVTKYVKEYSSQYYISKIKTLKATEKLVAEKYRGHEEQIVQARTNFKIAFFYEFQGQQLQSLRYYRQCYAALSQCADGATDDMLEQVKAVAEIVHFKICHILLLTNSVPETFAQFKAHMKRFTVITSMNLWRHYAWLADQYVVFAELLQQFTVSDAIPDADRGYYYQNAARYSQKRQASFEKIRQGRALLASQRERDSTARTRKSSGADGDMRTSFRGMIIVAPKFVGSALQFEEPMMDHLQMEMPTRNSYTEYLQEQEMSVAHGAIIMSLLQVALEKTNYAFVRRRGMLQYLIAQQHILEQHPAEALGCLKVAAELLGEERWVMPAETVLSQWCRCAIVLGRPREYLEGALSLYSNAAQTLLSRYEVEALHLNLMSLFEAALTTSSTDAKAPPHLPDSVFSFVKFPVRRREAFLTTTCTPLTVSPDYGQGAGQTPVEFALAGDTVVDMSAEKRMFDVTVAFDQKTVELGQSVLVTLTVRSRFVDELVCDEMKVYFTDKVIVKSIVGTDKMSSAQRDRLSQRSPVKLLGKSGSAESLNERDTNSDEVLVSNADTIYTSLAFPPRKDATFSFYVYISEPCFSKFTAPEMVLCLERVELCWYSTTRLDELRLHAESGGAGGVTPLRAPSQTGETDEEALTASSVAGAGATPNGVQAPRSASLVFNVSAFPDAVQRALQEVTLAAGKPHTLKDLVGFCADEQFGSVVVRKPTALISVMEPTQNVNLLQNVVQRVNVFLKIGQSDVTDGYVYLSSTHTPTAAADALFWYPDKKALEGCGSLPDDASLDAVLLHPMVINVAGQPVQPVHLTGWANPVGGDSTDAVVCLPLFLKCDTAKNVTITLRVELVPKGILRSLLTKDFTLTASFLSPFDVRYALGRDGSHCDAEAAALTASKPALLSTSLVCLNSLQHAIGVVGMHLRAAEQTGAVTTLVGSDGSSGSAAKLLHGEVPVPVRSQELITRSVYLKHSPVGHNGSAASPRSAYEQVTLKKEGLPPAASIVVPGGSLLVTWRILQSHILRRPFVPLSAASADSPLKGSPRTPAVGLSLHAESGVGGDTDWLHTLGRERDVQQGTAALSLAERDNRFLELGIRCGVVCDTMFPLPDIKVASAPFAITVKAPSRSVLLEPTEMTIVLRSNQTTLERVRVNVVANDAFLITGSTLTVVEVPARSTVQLTTVLLPVKAGAVAVPSVALVWDRGLNNSVTLYEAGQADAHVQRMFVTPR